MSVRVMFIFYLMSTRFKNIAICVDFNPPPWLFPMKNKQTTRTLKENEVRKVNTQA